MKKITLTLFCLISLNLLSQKSIDKPSQAEWDLFIEQRILAIQKDLLQLALDGKIKSYKDDSFTAFYSKSDIISLTQEETLIPIYDENGVQVRDSSIYRRFDVTEFKGISFCRSLPNNLLSFSSEETLLGVGIIYNPVFFGIPSEADFVLCYFSIEDISKNLSIEKLKFLQLAFQYARTVQSFENSNDTMLFLESKSRNLLLTKRNQLPLLDLQKATIKSSLIFMTDLMSNIMGYTYYDYQLKKESKYNEFPFNYYHVEIVLIHDGDNDCGVKDTAITMSAPFPILSQISYNPNGKVASFIFSLDASNSSNIKPAKNEKDLKFSISRAELNKYTNLQPMLWLFEDYYDWKMKR